MKAFSLSFFFFIVLFVIVSVDARMTDDIEVIRVMDTGDSVQVHYRHSGVPQSYMRTDRPGLVQVSDDLPQRVVREVGNLDTVQVDAHNPFFSHHSRYNCRNIQMRSSLDIPQKYHDFYLAQRNARYCVVGR